MRKVPAKNYYTLKQDIKSNKLTQKIKSCQLRKR